MSFLERVPPDYQRELYLGDNYGHDPRYDHPTRAEVSKLIFYCRLQIAAKKPANAFIALKDLTAAALKTLRAQQEYSVYLGHRPRVHNVQDPDDFTEADFGGEPASLRASALPSTPSLVDAAWNELLEKALKQSGAKPLRAWLQGLSTPGAPLQKLAAYRLQSIDALIIKAYFAEAQSQLKLHNFDGARKIYKQIGSEYPDSDASRRAEAALPKIVPVAVAYYKKEGDEKYHPRTAEPQITSIALYKKMYQEDPDGPQSDYALFKWGHALGTDVNQTPLAEATARRFLEKYPHSPLRAKGLYSLGLIMVHPSDGKIAEGIKVLMQIPREFPKAEDAPEALWMASFKADVVLHDYRTALEAMQQLHDKYPSSPRWIHTQAWVDWFKKLLAEGKGSTQ